MSQNEVTLPEEEHTMTACKRVLRTVELLDMILDHVFLDPESSLHRLIRWGFQLQRVNKTFYHHINGDTKAAQALYLKPQAAGLNFSTILTETEKLGIQNLRDCLSTEVSRSRVKIDMNLSKAPLERDAPSWGEILLIQPPVTEVLVRCEVMQGWRGTYRGLWDEGVHRPNGFRLKDIMEWARLVVWVSGRRVQFCHAIFEARADEVERSSARLAMYLG